MRREPSGQLSSAEEDGYAILKTQPPRESLRPGNDEIPPASPSPRPPGRVGAFSRSSISTCGSPAGVAYAGASADLRISTTSTASSSVAAMISHLCSMVANSRWRPGWTPGANALERALAEAALDRGLPVLGICAGGGDVVWCPSRGASHAPSPAAPPPGESRRGSPGGARRSRFLPRPSGAPPPGPCRWRWGFPSLPSVLGPRGGGGRAAGRRDWTIQGDREGPRPLRAWRPVAPRTPVLRAAAAKDLPCPRGSRRRPTVRGEARSPRYRSPQMSSDEVKKGRRGERPPSIAEMGDGFRPPDDRVPHGLLPLVLP